MINLKRFVLLYFSATSHLFPQVSSLMIITIFCRRKSSQKIMWRTCRVIYRYLACWLFLWHCLSVRLDLKVFRFPASASWFILFFYIQNLLVIEFWCHFCSSAESDRWIYEESWFHLQTEREGIVFHIKKTCDVWKIGKLKLKYTYFHLFLSVYHE